MLSLDRPLSIIDLEATGTDPAEARIIQVAILRMLPSDEYGSYVDEEWSSLIDPEVAVPTRVQDLTGITPDRLEGAPRLEEIGHHLHRLLHDADLCGYNAISYDVPLLEAECQRAFGRSIPGPDDRSVVDPLQIEKIVHARTLEAVFERYTGEPMTDAHDAAADVSATGRVLIHQLRKHFDDAPTPSDLATFQRGDYLDDGRKLKKRDDRGVEVCFGKHSGKTLTELQDTDPGYLDWMRREITDLRPHIDEALS